MGGSSCNTEPRTYARWALSTKAQENQETEQRQARPFHTARLSTNILLSQICSTVHAPDWHLTLGGPEKPAAQVISGSDTKAPEAT